MESNMTRLKEKGDGPLKRKRLRQGAIPSVFPLQPFQKISAPYPLPTKLAAALSRLCIENEQLEDAIHNFFEKENCNSLEELQEKLEENNIHKDDKQVMWKDNLALFISFESHPDTGCLILQHYVKLGNNLVMKRPLRAQKKKKSKQFSWKN